MKYLAKLMGKNTYSFIIVTLISFTSIKAMEPIEQENYLKKVLPAELKKEIIPYLADALEDLNIKAIDTLNNYLIVTDQINNPNINAQITKILRDNVDANKARMVYFLHTLAENGDIQNVKFLLDHGIDADLAEPTGKTALMKVVSNRKLPLPRKTAVIKELLDCFS